MWLSFLGNMFFLVCTVLCIVFHTFLWYTKLRSEGKRQDRARVYARSPVWVNSCFNPRKHGLCNKGRSPDLYRSYRLPVSLTARQWHTGKNHRVLTVAGQFMIYTRFPFHPAYSGNLCLYLPKSDGQIYKSAADLFRGRVFLSGSG